MTLKVKVLVPQLCPTLCHPMDCSLPGSSVHQILQARILEWVAISFSRGIFPGQGLNPSLLYCGQILYHLSHLTCFFFYIKLEKGYVFVNIYKYKHIDKKEREEKEGGKDEGKEEGRVKERYQGGN